MPDGRDPNVVLDELLTVPKETRDAAWREAFLAAVMDARLAFGREVATGGDGFPYVVLTRGAEALYTLRSQIEPITEMGYGAVFEPEGPAPWGFSFGDLATFRMFESFRPPSGWSSPEAAEAESGQGDLFRTEEQGEFAEVGSPSEEYLPLFVRRALGRFLERVGIPDPCVALVYRSHARHRLLALETDDPRILRYAFWYLPRDYSLIPLDDMVDVREVGVRLLAKPTPRDETS